MFVSSTGNIRYTLRGPCCKVHSRSKPVMLCKLTPYTFVFGFTDTHMPLHSQSYTLKYALNVLPSQDVEYQAPATKLLYTVNSELLITCSVPFDKVLGNTLLSQTQIAYFNTDTNIVYTPEGDKTGAYLIPNTPIITTSHQQNRALSIHVYNGILSTPYFKHSELSISSPIGDATLNIPESGMNIYPGVPKTLQDKGCPTVWKLYPPKIIVKVQHKYYTYTTDWEEVTEPITVDTIMNRGFSFTRLTDDVQVPDDMFEKGTIIWCNTLQDTFIHFVEVVSVGWVFRITFSDEFWRDAYPSEYLIWPEHNNLYWLFLCGELQ